MSRPKKLKPTYDPPAVFNSFFDQSGTIDNTTGQEYRFGLDDLAGDEFPSDNDPRPPHLPPGLSFNHWSLEAQSTEKSDNAPPIVTTGNWDVDDEGRIRTSAPGLSINLPNPGPPSKREISNLISRGLWFVPPGRTGTVHLEYQLEQSVLALLDITQLIVDDAINPIQPADMMTLEFMRAYSRDLGLFYEESRPPDIRSISGSGLISLQPRNSPSPERLPHGGRYLLVGVTAKLGDSSFFYPGPTCAVGWQATSWRQPTLISERLGVSGWLRGEFVRAQIANSFSIPRIRPRFGGQVGETSLSVTTSGSVSAPQDGGFAGKVGPDERCQLSFTGRASRGTDQQQWPVELTRVSVPVGSDVDTPPD